MNHWELSKPGTKGNVKQELKEIEGHKVECYNFVPKGVFIDLKDLNQKTVKMISITNEGVVTLLK